MTPSSPKALLTTALLWMPLMALSLQASDQTLRIDTQAGSVLVQVPTTQARPQQPEGDKPVRVGIAEDLTDDEEVGDPEGKVRISLPGGTLLDLEVPSARLDPETGEVLDNTISLLLPDGTEISLQLNPDYATAPESPKPVRVGIAEDISDEEEVGDPEGQVAVQLSTGAYLTIYSRPASARPTKPTKPTKPPRNGIAEDDTDVEEVGDPEGIIAILPGGGSVRLLSESQDQ